MFLATKLTDNLLLAAFWQIIEDVDVVILVVHVVLASCWFDEEIVILLD
jgi:hypothetical protein